MIHAFEGPSGSGKGYAVEHWEGPALRMERPVLPRCLDPWAGAWSSSFLEYQAIAAATMSRQDVVVDRFLLSRWVYRAWDDGTFKLRPTWYAEMNRSVRRLKTMAVAEAWDRIGQAIYLHPLVKLTVLLPELHVLEQQRSWTGKYYPFSGLIETRLYREIAERLISDPIQGVDVTIR